MSIPETGLPSQPWLGTAGWLSRETIGKPPEFVN